MGGVVEPLATTVALSVTALPPGPLNGALPVPLIGNTCVAPTTGCVQLVTTALAVPGTVPNSGLLKEHDGALAVQVPDIIGTVAVALADTSAAPATGPEVAQPGSIA